jgi:type I restriction enzyme S subunit
MSWKEIQIKDIGKVITGNTPPKNDSENYGGIYPFLKPTDMNIGERYTFLTDEFYSEKAFEKYKNSYIPPLSTCVVTIGTIGEKMCLTHDWCFTNQSVNSVIPNIEKYDGMFIFYLLKYNLYQVKYANAGTSSGREHVNKTTFSNIKVNVPNSIETQKRIAYILATYDDLIENNLKRIKLLEETAQNIYKEWFVNFRFPDYEHTEFDEESGLPVGWEKKNINEVFNIKYGKNLPTTLIKSSGKYNVYGASGEMGYYEEKNVLERVALITSRGNGSGEIHRTFQEETFVTNNSFVVFPKENYYQIPFFFITECLKSLNLKSYCSGSAQPQLTNASMNNLEMTLPSIDLIIDFKIKVSPIYDLIDKLYFQNQKLKEARDILLPRLMNRTIEV